jgi:hypothetical protein
VTTSGVVTTSSTPASFAVTASLDAGTSSPTGVIVVLGDAAQNRRLRERYGVEQGR